MQRRQFVEKVGLGSAALIAASAEAMAAPARQDEHQHRGRHEPLRGELAAVTVSFGAWPATADQPLDRMTTPDAPVAPNAHQLIPNVVTIKAGGSVRYAIAGLHQIAVYAPGTKPGDIDTSVLIPIPGAPPEVGLIDDPRNRVYRGVNPLPLPQDRVEVLQFDKRGLYLVICTVSVHFADNMYGWVKVLRA